MTTTASSPPTAGMQMCPKCSRNSRLGSRFCGYCGEQLNPHRLLLAAGTVLRDRYTVIRLLGMGGMGAVYFCDDTNTGQPWAVKSLFDKTLADQFRLEAETLRRLRHPQLPAVIDYFVAEGTPYFVMELIEGKGLDEIVTEKKRASSFLPVATVARWGVQLCDALAYIHSQTPPVIHRDIKPENIKFTPTGAIKLVDFGLLKLFDPAGGLTSRLIASMGSEGYTAYEQYLNIGATGPATDLYALGGSLYTLLTNEIPPSPPDRLATPGLLKPIRVINAAVTRELEIAVAKAMEIESVDRFGSALQFRAALLAAVPQALPAPLAPLSAPTHQAGPASTATLPYRFHDGVSAHTPLELAAALETHTDEGAAALYNGDLLPWFRSLGRLDLAQRADNICQGIADRQVGLECLIRLLNPALPAPHLSVDATALAFGALVVGTVSTQVPRVTNSGRGYLHGRVTASTSWLTCAPTRFGLYRGESVRLTVTANADGLTPGTDYRADLIIASNGGSQTTPVTMTTRRRGLLRIISGW